MNLPFTTNLHVETWILLADNDMGWYRILLSETHLICHLTPYLHLRKYLIICKSKEKSSKQILAPVLVEIDNTCRQRFSVNSVWKPAVCYNLLFVSRFPQDCLLLFISVFYGFHIMLKFFNLSVENWISVCVIIKQNWRWFLCKHAFNIDPDARAGCKTSCNFNR